MTLDLALDIIKVLVTCVTITACGPDKAKEDAKPSDVFADLRVMYDARLDAYEGLVDEFGWPSVTDCDATLWAGIVAFAGAGIDLALAEHFPGEIHRRPVKPCWTEKDGDVGSKSTVSNDMLTGYLLGIYARKDLQAAMRLAKFGEDNQWVMGKPYPEMASRVVMSDNLKSLLGRILFKLSKGSDDRSYRSINPLYLPVFQDYERHIQTWGIYLFGELDGTLHLTDVTGMMYARLEANHKADPDDAFIGAVYGLYSGDIETPAKQLLGKYPSPAYVRGAGVYRDVHWLAAAKIILDHAEKK